ncbi:hypothetical protein BGZ49_006375, partial [Haplosporangium sp. Z 27]
ANDEPQNQEDHEIEDAIEVQANPNYVSVREFYANRLQIRPISENKDIEILISNMTPALEMGAISFTLHCEAVIGEIAKSRIANIGAVMPESLKGRLSVLKLTRF